MPCTRSRRVTPTSTSASDVSPPATFTGYRRTKATNSTRSQLAKSVTFSPLSARRTTATAPFVSSIPYSLPTKQHTKRTKRTTNITKPKAVTPSSSSSPSSSPSSSINRCARCRGTDHQRSTSRRCPYFKGRQTTSARINNTQKHYSYNVDYYEAVFDTISDDGILAALAEVAQDQDPNTTSQSTIVVDDYEDSDSEDEPLIRRRPGWKSASSSEPIQFDDEGGVDLQRPLTQVISTQSSSSSHASSSRTLLAEWIPSMPSTMDTTSGCMAIVCPTCSSQLLLSAVLEN